MRAHIETLDAHWHWREASGQGDLQMLASAKDIYSTEWRPTSRVPSEVHVELQDAGLIPDPFIGFNEHRVQWVGEREWLYRCVFAQSTVGGATRASRPFSLLQFEGLDTFCEIYLNGVKVAVADNMFRTYLVPISDDLLRSGGDNVLLLHFKSAKLIAKDLERRYGRVRAGSTNLGDPSRVYVRKAQYHWRWDWGPEFMTCGPYRPIRLLTYTSRISSFRTRALVRAMDSDAFPPVLSVDICVSGRVQEVHAIRCVLRQAGNTLDSIAEETVEIVNVKGEGEDSSELEVNQIIRWELEDRVHLWWPTGYGDQILYDVELTLLAKDLSVLDSAMRRVGFRQIRLLQEPINEPDRYGTGTTFMFEVNGVQMFMGGSNWIPADSFLTTISADRYRAWLTLLRDGNQNMVRLWGGGVYEPDVFYDICDELGILVWQDFQFACGVYPAHADFVESVKKEAEDNVKRLRHHPSLALFCGNNEDYQQVLQWGDVTDLPARILYEDVLPNIVQELTDPPIPYHCGSPYGGKGWNTAEPTVGDIHQWDVWGGKERAWQDYGTMGGRFVSEFGIPSMPNIRTIDFWLDGDTQERWSQSKLMTQHNRAGSHERRFAIVMNENFRLTGDFETHVYNTQIMQSEAVSLAYRMWRREWRGKGREYCAGALVWQLNDCWPVTSWSLADYFLRPKPAYYTISRELKPISVGIFRTVAKNRPNDRPLQFYEFGAFQSVGSTIEVWGTNSTLKPYSIIIELSAFDLVSLWTETEVLPAQLEPNQSTELWQGACPCPPAKDMVPTPSYSVVVQARLLDKTTNEVLARYCDWPQPFRYTEYPNPGIQLQVRGEEVTVTVDKPVKALVLSCSGADEVKWSNNTLDVVPGDPQIVFARGLAGRSVLVAHMGNEKAHEVHLYHV